MEKGHGYLRDGKGNKSSMRLSFFILLGYSLIMGTYVTIAEGSVLGLTFISGIVALSATAKIIQNSQEVK